MLAQPFVQHALLAGSLIALASGLLGYFVVLRAQVFAGDTLSHVAFTGAVAAAAIGVDLRVGLFAAGIAVALALGGLGRRAQADDVTTGIVFAGVLGLGVFLLDRLSTGTQGNNGTVAARTLFGSIFGLSAGAAWLAAAIAAALLAGVVALARPLLFASVDPHVAQARGVPVRALGLGFLVLVGIDAGEAAQAIGALLLLGLLAVPAGAAHLLSARPYAAMALSAAIALGSMIGGIVLSYYVSALPPSSAIVGLACAAYVLSALRRRRLTAPARRRAPSPRGAANTSPGR